MASDMILYIHSEASYLSEPRARSRASGHYFLGDKLPYMTMPPTNRPRLNGPMHSISQIMLNVMGSAAEAEIGAAYINGQEAFTDTHLTPQNGAPTARHTSPSRQLRRQELRQRHHEAKTIESDRHALLLDTRPHKPRSVPHLLAARHH